MVFCSRIQKRWKSFGIAALLVLFPGCTPRILDGLLPTQTATSLSTSIQSAIWTNPRYLVADGSSYSVVTVTVLDSVGLPLSDKLISLTSSRGSIDLITPPATRSDASGTATFRIRSTRGGVASLAAIDTTDHISLTSTSAITFSVGQPISTQATLTALQPTLPADGSTTGIITVLLLDAQGNPVPQKNIVLTSSRNASDTVSGPKLTDDLGIASFTVKSYVSGLAVFSAEDLTDELLLFKTASVNFLPGAVNTAFSNVVANPTSVVADGTSDSTITVSLRDLYGNGVAGKTVSLASNRGLADVINPSTGVTDPQGVVTFRVTSTATGVASYTATNVTDSITLVGTPNVTFIPSSTSATHSIVSISKSSSLANGKAAVILTATLADSNDNRIPGKTITVSSTRGSSDTVNPLSVTSDGSGVAQFLLTSKATGASTYTVENSSDGVLFSQSPSVVYKSYAYITNTSKNSIFSSLFDSLTGLLTTIPGIYSTGVTPLFVAVHPSGNFVYVVNNASNTVSQFSVDPANGVLKPMTPSTVGTGAAPYSMALDPTGN